ELLHELLGLVVVFLEQCERIHVPPPLVPITDPSSKVWASPVAYSLLEPLAHGRKCRESAAPHRRPPGGPAGVPIERADRLARRTYSAARGSFDRRWPGGGSSDRRSRGVCARPISHRRRHRRQRALDERRARARAVRLTALRLLVR